MNVKNSSFIHSQSTVKKCLLIIFVISFVFLYCADSMAVSMKPLDATVNNSNANRQSDDSQINIPLGDSYTLKVTGGAPPFVTKDYDQKIITVLPLDLHTFLITGKAAGSTKLTITDRKGGIIASRNITVTNKSVNLTIVFDKEDIFVGDIITPSISGGTPPYKLVVIDTKRVELLPNQTNTFKFTAKLPGKTQLAISDSTGQVVLKDIIVLEKPKPVTPIIIKVISSEINIGEQTTFTIDGGAPPYSVNVLNNKIIDLSQTGTNSYQITGKMAGTTPVTVFDSKGQTAQQTITVAQKSQPISISTTSDEIQIGESVTLKVNGGTPPFSINALNSKVVDISQTDVNEFRITGKTSGMTSLTIFDAKRQNAQKMIKVLEKPAPVNPLTVNVLPEIRVGETTILTISGGAPPYKVGFLTSSTGSSGSSGSSSSSGSSLLRSLIIDIAPIGSNSYQIKGKMVGKVQLKISDANGQSVLQSISVAQKSLSLTAYVPSEVEIDKTVTLSVNGGTPPYQVKPSNSLVGIVKTNNNNFQIQGLRPGTTLLVIYDKNGTRVAKTITITQQKLTPLTVSLSLSEIYVGESTQLVVKGGVSPYNIDLSDYFMVEYSQTNSPIGTIFNINAKRAGDLLITIYDNNGQKVQKPLSVLVKSQPLSTNIIPDIYTGEQTTLTVNGGTPPYNVFVQSNKIISVSQNGSNFYIYGQSPGTISLNILDSKGQSIQQLITVLEKILPLKINLLSSDMEVGDTVSFNVEGGNPPYFISNPDNKIINITPAGTNSFKISAIDDGKAQFKVYDSKMQSVFKTINIAKKPVLLNVILPANQIGIKQSLTFTVTGNPPYYVANLNPDIAEIIQQPSGDSFKITGNKVGKAQFVIFDSEGQNVLQTVTVINPFTISFSTENAQAGNEVTLTVRGGTPPYYVSSPSSEIDISTPSSDNYNEFKISSSSYGEYNITVYDSKAQQVSKNITFYPSPLSTLLASNAIYTGKSTVIVIKGGVFPYTVIAKDGSLLKIAPITEDKDIYLVTGLAQGDTQIIVTDANNSVKVENIKVKFKW